MPTNAANKLISILTGHEAQAHSFNGWIYNSQQLINLPPMSFCAGFDRIQITQAMNDEEGGSVPVISFFKHGGANKSYAASCDDLEEWFEHANVTILLDQIVDVTVETELTLRTGDLLIQITLKDGSRYVIALNTSVDGYSCDKFWADFMNAGD